MLLYIIITCFTLFDLDHLTKLMSLNVHFLTKGKKNESKINTRLFIIIKDPQFVCDDKYLDLNSFKMFKVIVSY